ncbi:MAG: polysaccharide lyase family 7 protein [Anaerolineae bacterium]|nr:polysaccharide lyase family 7 protein [Anaerolineae bacterium]
MCGVLLALLLGLNGLTTAQSTTESWLTVTLSLQSRSSASNQSFEVSLVSPSGKTVQITISDANSRIVVNGLVAGNYLLRVKHPQYLAFSMPVSLVGGANELTIGPLKAGDANNDNQVTLADVSFIAMFFNRRAGTAGYDPRADLNGDTRISLLDFSLLTSNYGQTGAPELEIPSHPPSEYPGQLIDLTNWKITLPLASPNDEDSPLEIFQPQLARYIANPWFLLNPESSGVIFRAPVNGTTTSGSSYPRSELREMASNGLVRASWSSTRGTHTMLIDQAITAVPQTKRHVVAGQIHDSSDDVIVIRLEYPKLYVNVDGKNVLTLDENYVLGERFTVQFVVSGGKTAVYYNGSTTPVYTLNKSFSNAYFKAGAYTQSNCDREGSSSLCNASNFGEVVIYRLAVRHE